MDSETKTKDNISSNSFLKGALMGSQYNANAAASYFAMSPIDNSVPKLPDKDTLRRLVLTKYLEKNPDRILSVKKDEDIREAFTYFVLNVPMVIDRLPVPRRWWAKAFYESEMINSAKCLFEALFSQEEMRECTLNGKNQTKELSAVKMLAILRASCWMKNKEQDPYYFNPDLPQFNLHPTKEEQDKIEKKVFTERRSQANRKNNKKRKLHQGPNRIIDLETLDSDNSQSNMDFDNSHYDLNDSKSEGSSEGKQSPTPSHFEVPEFGELEALYYHHPEEFLDTLIPKWREDFIFIDGLLVEKADWKKAFEEATDPVKAAWKLFLTLFSNEEITTCTLNGKNGTTELCPVKKLAIIRAVEFMAKCRAKGVSSSDPLATYWENDDQDCNVFPIKEDKEKIETKVFTEKRYQQSRYLSNNLNGAKNWENNSEGGNFIAFMANANNNLNPGENSTSQSQSQ